MAERLRSRGLMGELASEFAGTFILILFGVGVVAQVVAAGIGDNIGTAILLFLVVAITDTHNTAPAANLAPVVIGLLVVAIGMAWDSDAGYAINPARDFGPRLASFLTGYGTAFRDQYGNLYFWVPIIAPLIGGIVGVGLYDFLIGRFLPAEGPDEVGRLLEQSDGSDSQVSARTQ